MSHPTLYLIDAHAYIHRAYHALPPLASPRGIMVNAVFGFTRLIFKIIREKKPTYIAVCFDHPALTIRKKIYPPYKATRKPVDEDLIVQIPMARKTIEMLGLAVVDMPGYEADDIMATLATKASDKNIEVVIVSGDKDVLQLVSDHIAVWNTHKDIIMNTDTVKLKRGIESSQLVDMFALMGDASDNIPGVPGIGEKTAVKLIQQYGSMENLYKMIEELPEKIKDKLDRFKEQALLSKKLVTLDTDVPIDITFAQMPGQIPEAGETLIEHFKALGFNSLLADLKLKNADILSAEKEYVMVTEKHDLVSLLKHLEQRRLFALDVETTGLDTRSSAVVGISLCAEKNKAFYIPVKEVSSDSYSMLKEFLENSNNRIVGHNLKFDFLMLRSQGMHLPGLYFDTMIASYVLNPSRGNHRLKNLALEYLSFRMMEYKELVGKGKNELPIEEVDIRNLVNYACADADATYMLYEIMSGELEEKNLKKLFFDVEMPLLKILGRMERAGIKLDRSFLEQLKNDFTSRLSNLIEDIYHTAGQEFNVHSPKQVSFILFEKLKLPVIRRIKTGFSTDDDVLEELSSHHRLPRLLRDYREFQKLKSTYIDAMEEGMDRETSRIHASFNQTVTATGRLSSSDPNLQNIPIRTENGRLIRRVFIPEEGHVFISADYSQIDLRVLAHLSRDEALVCAFNTGGDIHRATASEIYKVSQDIVTEEMRSHAKAINFGIVYGQQAFGLAQSIGISKTEAKDFIDNYFKKYSGVKQWIDHTLKQAKETGKVTTILGRIRYLPELSSGQPRMRAFGERMAMNTPIQGSAADIIKVAMINIAREIDTGKLESRILVQVHDDLLLEVPEDEVHIIKKILKQEMEHAVELNVPLVVELKKGNNWRDMQRTD